MHIMYNTSRIVMQTTMTATFIPYLVAKICYKVNFQDYTVAILHFLIFHNLPKGENSTPVWISIYLC